MTLSVLIVTVRDMWRTDGTNREFRLNSDLAASGDIVAVYVDGSATAAYTVDTGSDTLTLNTSVDITADKYVVVDYKTGDINANKGTTGGASLVHADFGNDLVTEINNKETRDFTSENGGFDFADSNTVASFTQAGSPHSFTLASSAKDRRFCGATVKMTRNAGGQIAVNLIELDSLSVGGTDYLLTTPANLYLKDMDDTSGTQRYYADILYDFFWPSGDNIVIGLNFTSATNEPTNASITAYYIEYT